MAGFVFRFDSVLRQRRHAEAQAQRRLAQVLRDQQQHEQQLGQMQHAIRDARSDLGQSLGGPVNMADVGRFARHVLTQRVAGQQLARQLAGDHQRVAAMRAELLEAARQRKSLELLRERDLALWNKAQQRREQAALDEVGQQQHARRVKSARGVVQAGDNR
jgi:flagellar FliJ protein